MCYQRGCDCNRDGSATNIYSKGRHGQVRVRLGFGDSNEDKASSLAIILVQHLSTYPAPIQPLTSSSNSTMSAFCLSAMELWMSLEEEGRIKAIMHRNAR